MLVTVVPYNPQWPQLFEEEAKSLRALLGENLVALFHIGSTSVPGLAAKPIIDILPVVQDIDDGVFVEGEEPAGFINNRARLSMEYKRSDLQMKISAQHVGVWGQDPQIDKNGRFIMNEAWAKLNFGKNFFAQLGRQTLSYDDERILADWIGT